LGILLKENTIKTRALKEGIIEEGDALTEVQKIQVRFMEIMTQTEASQGDLARTLTSTTNVWRSLKSVVKESMILFGVSLLPAVNRIGAVLKKWFVGNQTKIKEWGEVADKWLNKAIDWFQDLLDLIKDEGWSAGLKKIGADVAKAFKLTFEFLTPIAVKLGKAIALGFVGLVKDIIADLLPKREAFTFEEARQAQSFQKVLRKDLTGEQRNARMEQFRGLKLGGEKPTGIGSETFNRLSMAIENNNKLLKENKKIGIPIPTN